MCASTPQLSTGGDGLPLPELTSAAAGRGPVSGWPVAAARRQARELRTRAIAPGASRVVEDVLADTGQPLHPGRPVGRHVPCVVVRGMDEFGYAAASRQHLVRDPVRGRPGLALNDPVRLAVAGEGELAAGLAVGALVDHAADRLRKSPRG